MKEEEKKEEKEQKRSKLWYFLLTLIIILLIVVIIFLLMRKEEEVPTGNTNIFEIDCDCEENVGENEQQGEDTTENNSGTNSNNGTGDSSSANQGSNETPPSGEGEEEYELIVEDDNIIWDSTNKLNIFSNPAYGGEELIAPGSHNSYHFIVRNNSTCSISYELIFKEENPYGINMKYRIQKNGEYLQEEYVSYDELEIDRTLLSAGDQDEFYLEWIWEESSNDTEIGSNPDANYSLQLQILGIGE